MKVNEIFFKRIITLLLCISMIITSADLNVFAEENKVVEISSEIVDLGEFSLENSGDISLFTTQNGSVDLKEGNYEKWIDRLDVPEYGIEFYNKLVEYSDNDGENDLLISEEGFSKDNAHSIKYTNGTDTFNAIELVTLKNPTSNEISYVYKLVRAIYDAFIMDHPEVFWLSGKSSSYSVQYSYSNGTNEQIFYFLLKMHEGSVSTSFNDFLADDYKTEAAIVADIQVRDNAVDTILKTADVKNAKNNYELVKAFNKWLTENNEYNTLVAAGDSYGNFEAHNCLSALKGSEGTKGPVCEGYAEAFKILCDKKEIPCVLASGWATSNSASAGEAHAWNYTKIDNGWYGVDVTWNDPVVYGSSGKKSNHENENYLLVGNKTLHGSLPFETSHKLGNTVSSGTPVAFLNGPIVSETAYSNNEIPETPTYTISWDIDGDGTIDDRSTYEHGATPSHSDGVKQADKQYTYTFTGWSPSITTVTGDKTYTAQFSRKLNSYTISWDIDGDGTVDEQSTYEYGKMPSHADGIKQPTGEFTYFFIGWSPVITTVTGDKTYTAQFSTSSNSYMISWDIDGDGTVDEQSTYEYGKMPSHADGVKEADAQYTYTFTSWNPTIKSVTGNQTYTAQFSRKLNSYTISWDIDGDGTVDEQSTYEYGVTPSHTDGVKLSTDEFIYTFTGWSPSITDVTGDKTYTAQFSEMAISKPGIQGVNRIYGANRIETGLAIANKYLELGDLDTFESIIIARSDNFADALSASYLAYVKNSPIILTNISQLNVIADYVKSNLKDKGNVYIIGGTDAVSSDLDNELSDYNVKRISGKNRYLTNLEILKEAEVTGGDLIIATGKNFADSLSASAVKKPILMVNKQLTEEQKEYLSTLTIDNLYIVGGTNAVSPELENELKDFATVERIFGETRNETSVAVANKFFDSPATVIIANSKNYPDGLCGGPLASLLGTPLILTSNGKTPDAEKYINENMIDSAFVLGGESALTTDTVNTIFK